MCVTSRTRQIFVNSRNPSEYRTLKMQLWNFKNIHKTMKQPFGGYADFGCILERVNDVGDVTTGIAESSYKVIEYQFHTPASYFTKFASIDSEFDLSQHDNFAFPQENTYVGEDAAEHFLDYVQTVADKIFNKNIKKPKEMIYAEEDKRKFEEATKCHILRYRFCETSFPLP